MSTNPAPDHGEGPDTVRVILQARCLYCGVEHYAPMVWVISLGEAGCAVCGRIPPVFHDRDEYRQARQDHLAGRERPRSETDPAAELISELRNDQERESR